MTKDPDYNYQRRAKRSSARDGQADRRRGVARKSTWSIRSRPTLRRGTASEPNRRSRLKGPGPRTRRRRGRAVEAEGFLRLFLRPPSVAAPLRNQAGAEQWSTSAAAVRDGPGSPLNRHADGIDVVELGRLGDRHAQPVRPEPCQSRFRSLREGFESWSGGFASISRRRAHLAVFDRGHRWRSVRRRRCAAGRREVDADGLRPVEFVLADADDRAAAKAVDEDGCPSRTGRPRRGGLTGSRCRGERGVQGAVSCVGCRTSLVRPNRRPARKKRETAKTRE